MRRLLHALALPALALAVCTGVIGAQGMPKLPDPLPLAKSADSPGQVTFTHLTHVDAAKPNCVACHPKDFGLLGSRGGAKTPITHANFEQGRQCARCHDGKQAFAIEDDCANCHVAE
jgi:c(7)-type cytochrome triheme protein